LNDARLGGEIWGVMEIRGLNAAGAAVAQRPPFDYALIFQRCSGTTARV
jgi:hypothetical protein